MGTQVTAQQLRAVLFQESRFNSHPSLGGSLPSITPVPEDLMPYSDAHGTKHVHYTCKQNTHI